MGVPVQRLQGLLDGREFLPDILKERSAQICQEQKELSLLLELCCSLLKQEVQVETLDADLLSLKLEFSQRKEELLMSKEQNRRLEKIEGTAKLISKCGIIWVCCWQLTRLFPQYSFVWNHPWVVLPPVAVVVVNMIVLCVVRQIKR